MTLVLGELNSSDPSSAHTGPSVNSNPVATRSSVTVGGNTASSRSSRRSTRARTGSVRAARPGPYTSRVAERTHT
jgi:hypothetical protein